MLSKIDSKAPRTAHKPTKATRSTPSEATILAHVLMALKYHPRVAMAWRVNSGAVKTDDRFIRYGFVGCSDILGILRGGRLLAVECKSAKGRLTVAQQSFLDTITKAGGLAIVARGVDDVIEGLKE